MFSKHEKYSINLLGGIFLAALTLAAGISVYVVMQRQAESMLSKGIESLLQSNQRLFQSVIEQALSNTQTVVSRPFLIRNLQLLASKPDHATAQVELQQIAQSFLLTSFTGVAFYDIRGLEVARAGLFSYASSQAIPPLMGMTCTNY